MNLANRWLFIVGLVANVLLVLFTVIAYDQGWDGAYWPIFIIWTVVTFFLVLLAFLGAAQGAPSGGQHQ